MRDKPANHKRGKNPVCIVFDYSRTLAQKEFPVGLRSWLMREYGDDAARNLACDRGRTRETKRFYATEEQTGG
ncbi:hypothetical protein [Escherichia coli]|uniref:hypothetical protein n=1 Tax=Escherichia coli TaxID=562 RepID=UPI0007507A18|nr:hypothetical protein [Escherichia coli]KUT81668.1 hypothetical protein AWF07_00630 [Escherichia coli]MCL8360856.1 hypothetical protein [Escherichia coli]MCV0510737.1 hypothetical protein [Escherichia coli]HAH5459871.1 hypothetical protein [Escherichia coli]